MSKAGAGNVVEGDPKTLSSRRTLPLDDGLVGILRASVRYAEERLALGAAHADSGYVPVNEAGQPYTPDTLTRMWHKLAKAAQVASLWCTLVSSISAADAHLSTRLRGLHFRNVLGDALRAERGLARRLSGVP